MNSPALLSEVFSLNDPVTSEGDYINSHVTGFGTDEDDNSQRVGGLVSMPDTNGVRYHAQQPVMQDLQYSGSSALAMTPPDSCPDSFSPTSGPLFPHISRLQHPFDRMADYQRVPALQPPTGMPAGMQSSGHNLNSIPALMGRNNSYGSYALQRGIGNIGIPLGGMNDLSRSHGYPGTPRALDSGMDRSQNNLYQQPIVESSQRSQPQVEAPPFDDTTVLHTVVAEFGGQYQTVKPDVQAKMGRGPFPAEGKWTCYRRNYFAVTCGFDLHPWPPTAPLYIRYPDQTLEPIRGFSMAISAIVNGQYGETRELVQHTPKRDKQSERKPARVVLQPAPPPSFTATSTVNGNLSGFPLGSQSMDYNLSFAGTPQPCQPPTSHVFERIQFQKATANNGKRRAQQQYYNLVVELYAEVASSVPGETEWVQIARRHSHPLVVRGRSPGHYKDGRRGSTGSMGPDGAGGDNTCGVLPHGLGQTGRSHMLMYDPSHRAGLSYGRSDHRKMNVTDHSPLSDSPLISSSSSSGFEYSMIDTMDPMDTIKSDLYLKSDPYQDNTYTGVPSHQHRQSNAGGYDPVYSTTYSRYDPIQNSHSLCT
ncbi:p53-like transcription factor DNA-binding [Penicillium concentricum]|uniref:P53-like transcription factor DNA-binding n=1 Tax=Penicillium concentricum TaxID=293559 RepID=A0A9W9S898_9EURO|nr:p53-like transcription factor DNA-binding [Penicillium concentricum]KAJ5373215.1 p53-like transcription factor DNA-binding [Penicillium concentricum]